jgi:hypothetical protein
MNREQESMGAHFGRWRRTANGNQSEVGGGRHQLDLLLVRERVAGRTSASRMA